MNTPTIYVNINDVPFMNSEHENQNAISTSGESTISYIKQKPLDPLRIIKTRQGYIRQNNQ